MHALPSNQRTTFYNQVLPLESRDTEPRVRTGPPLCGTLLPQTTVGLFIGGEGAVADVPEGVARLQFGFLAV